MARAGDHLENPATGLRTVFRQTAADTGGRLLQVEWVGDAGWTTGPDHVHPHQLERFACCPARWGCAWMAGSGYCIEGEELVAEANAPHAAWNAGDGTVRTLVDFEPALRTETAFEALAGLGRDGRTTRSGAPRNPLQAALVLHEFRDEIALARPPAAVQRVVFGALARLGRLVGLRAAYPYPYSSSG